MIKPAVLVIDVGTTGVKTSLFDFTCRPINTIFCAHGTAGWNLRAAAERWWQVAASSASELSGRNPDRSIVAVGVTGFMHLVVALDAEGKPLALPPASPASVITRSLFDRVLGEFGLERIHQITGSRLDMSSVPVQILAWRERAAAELSRVAVLLPVKDFIRFRLTGEIATDEIDACGTMLYDVHHRQWRPELVSYCGLEERNLSPIMHCTDRAGRVTSEAAEAMRIPQGIPVAVGGGDDVEILGSGASKPSELCEHVGSTGSFLMPLESPLMDPAFRFELYPAIEPGEWVLGGPCSNVTRALDWFLGLSPYGCGPPGAAGWQRVQADFSEMLAGPFSVRPMFLPYLYGERAPYWNADLSASWIGLRSHHTASDLLYAVVEGICFSLRSVLDGYRDLGFAVERVYSSGGFNALGAQEFRASVYGTPIRLPRNGDPTSAATAAITLCMLGELAHPREATAWLEFGPEAEPDPVWQEALNERFALFTGHTRRLLSSARPAPNLTARS